MSSFVALPYLLTLFTSPLRYLCYCGVVENQADGRDRSGYWPQHINVQIQEFKWQLQLNVHDQDDSGVATTEAPS